MKGFEISINDAAPILAASDDIVTIIISTHTICILFPDFVIAYPKILRQRV